jgi:hypothetical protein
VISQHNVTLTRNHGEPSWLEILFDQRRRLWLVRTGTGCWQLFRVGKWWKWPLWPPCMQVSAEVGSAASAASLP